MTRNLYALLVGIDQYPQPVGQLYGCVNDVSAMEAYLQERANREHVHLHLQVLKDAEAHRSAIIAGFHDHLGRADKDDVVLFYYSGHGSQELSPPEFWPFEPDHMDETLVCWDSRLANGWDLADKELAQLIADVATNGAHTVVVLDCCHSGSGTRDARPETALRWTPADTRPRPLDTFLFSSHTSNLMRRSPNLLGNPSDWLTLPEGRHVLLAACRDSETAREYYADGKQWGAFSYFLRTSLEDATSPLTYGDLFKQTQARLLSHIAGQTPQLEALQTADFDQLFLGGAVIPHSIYFTVHYSVEGWIMDGGEVHGIAPPLGVETTTVALFPLDASPAVLRQGPAVANAVARTVRPQESKLEIVDPSTLDPARTYKAIVTGLPLPPIAVAFVGDPEGLSLARTALAHSGPNGTSSLYVEATADVPQFQLSAQGGQYLITRPSDDRPLVAQIVGYNLDNAHLAISRLEHIARWMKTAELHNPGCRLPINAVRMTVICDGVEQDETNLLLEYRFVNSHWQQPTYTVRIQNLCNEPLYCAVLGLWESFGIDASYFPSGGQWLQPGHEVITRLKYASVPKGLWQAGVTERRDLLKLIVCTAEFDPTLLEQPSLDAPRMRSVRSFDSRNPLNRLLNRIQTREAGNRPEDDIYNDWVTSEIVITVRRPRELMPVPHSGPPTSIGASVEIAPHPKLVAQVRLTTVPAVARELGNLTLPPILQTGSQPLYFSASRGADPGLSVLEFSKIEDHTVVTPTEPLHLTIATSLAPDEHVVPIGFDGEFFLPLGSARVNDGGIDVELIRLPAPVSVGNRDLKGSIRILFQKVVARPLGLDYPYPILAAVTAVGNGEFVYEPDLEKIKARVVAARQITLYIHGLTGDTRGMVASASRFDPSDLLLAFDYESINTPIEELARALAEKLKSVGLGIGHTQNLQIVAHSLGGLVARWFIEREGGVQIVKRLIVLGTPSGGTPWATLQQWATIGIGIALNSFTAVAWPIPILGALIASIERVDVTLDQLQPNSDFLNNLAASTDPHVSYVAIAGNTSILSAATELEANTQTNRIGRLLTRLGYGVANMAFFSQPNDIAVSVGSVHRIDANRFPEPVLLEIASDHQTFFESEAGVSALRQILA